MAIPATGTSVNPARSIGPALFSGTEALQQVWLFIVAPLLGGLAAGVVYPAVFGHGVEPVRGSCLRFGVRQPAGVPGYGAPDALQQQWQQQWQQPWASGGQTWQQPPVTWAPPPAQGRPSPGPDDAEDGRTQIRPQQ